MEPSGNERREKGQDSSRKSQYDGWRGSEWFHGRQGHVSQVFVVCYCTKFTVLVKNRQKRKWKFSFIFHVWWMVRNQIKGYSVVSFSLRCFYYILLRKTCPCGIYFQNYFGILSRLFFIIGKSSMNLIYNLSIGRGCDTPVSPQNNSEKKFQSGHVFLIYTTISCKTF